MTNPAVAVLIDSRYQLPVAADAVLSEEFFPLPGEPNGFRDSSRVKYIRIPHALDRLPEHMASFGVVGQVAIDALLPAMPCIVKPVFILRFHDMAGRAKLRSARSCVEPRRTEAHEPTYANSRQNQQQDDFRIPLPSLGARDVYHGRSRHVT